MTIHTLHNISGYLMILAILAKVITHYYLDKLYQRNVNLASILLMPLKYLKPYRSDVNNKHIPLKKLCNFLLPLAGIFLLLNLIPGLVIYLNECF